MNEAEKERLIKKDIASIENKDRHVFNQGYEMGVKKNKSEIPNACGDAISRQAVIELCDVRWLDDFAAEVRTLPSVTPQQRTGRWITSHIPESVLCECSECGFTCGAYSFNYCPDCGAKMVEPQKSEDKE